jgi:myo-inositol 2-dehydrogenase/D-chiro-inositol 1-dehydrogenase
MNKANIGVIGAGRIGRIHARNLKFLVPGAKLVAISDLMEESARQVAAELEIPVCERDYRRLLDMKELDAVVICASTDTHARLIIEAAQAGKDVFCEKPVALDLKLIDQVLQVVEQAGVKLMVGFNRRFDPSFKKARDLVAAGKIGTPHLLRISSRDPQPPPPAYVKVSGGLFLDMMIHDFDMARYLMGEEVAEVMAAGNCLVDPEIGRLGDVDTAVVLLKYPSGALGTIDNSRKAIYGYDQRIEVFGSAGSVAVGNLTPTGVTLNNVDAVQSDKPLYFFLERYQESYLAEMHHFVQSISNNLQPAVGGVDGKVAVQMGYAAKESLASRNFVSVR